jgi:Aflatoxin regulatory protein
MDPAAESELLHVEDPLTLSSGLLDVEMPLASVHDPLRHSQLSLPWFDFFSSASGELSPNGQMHTSSSTGNLSDHSAPSLVTNPSSISPHPEATSAPEETPCRTPHRPCINLAIRVLSSMRPDLDTCVLSMIGQDGDGWPQPSRGADAVLNLNQSALAAVRSVLQCSCFRVPQVLLLVTAICSQIGALYRQVVDIYSQRYKPNTNSAVPFNSGGKFETQRRDFFIGNYRLSQGLEAAVIRQVLLGMLRELEVVIRDIAFHAGQSPAVNDLRSDLMLSGVRARMVEFLHTRVRALTSALDHLESDVGAGLPPNSHY